MQLLQKLLLKFDGLHFKQEYLCLALEPFPNPIHAYFVNDGVVVKDITNHHAFTGYNPLIFAFNSLVFNGTDIPANIQIAFSQQVLQPNEVLRKRDALATLYMKLMQRPGSDGAIAIYYEGIEGHHQFLSSFHQYIMELNNRLFNKRPGNVFLNDNLYKQVQIAYSVPRLISLVTLRQGDAYNLFPTDLHGLINANYYVSSLRHKGKACKQVEATKKIVISQVDSALYKTVYSLGKNHMQDPGPKEDYPFSQEVSGLFKLPLPQSTLHYRELELTESFQYGIHQLLLYKIVSSHTVNGNPSTLAHIHNSYATWRYRKGFGGDYLLR